jgi:hypothetical protein
VASATSEGGFQVKSEAELEGGGASRRPKGVNAGGTNSIANSASRSETSYAGDVARAQVEVSNARRGWDAAKAARDALGRGVDAPERVREAAGRIAGAMRRLGPESAAKLVQRLVPMVPTSAAGLVKSAVELGKLMMFGRDPERERGRER